MKVIHSSGTWLPITETWLYNQVISLPLDVEAHIVCGRIENAEQFGIPQIHCFAKECRGVTLLKDRLIRLALRRRQLGFWYRTAAKVRPGVWHSHFAGQAWKDRRTVESCGAKHVLSVYGADISQNSKTPPWDVRTREVLRQVDLVLCEGPCMARQVKALGCPQHRVRIHHLGISTQHIEFQPRRWHPGTPLRVLIAATFREKKGIPYAIESLAQIESEVDLQITLIGDATAKPGDADQKRQILAAIEKGRLSSRTRLLGFQPYSVLMEEAKKHHIFLSPSVQAQDGDNEGGSPVAITEMAASGMLIISSRHCDIPEVIPHGVAGLLAEERDVNGLVRHLRWAISNPEAWLALQQAARTHIEQEYNAMRQGTRLARIYRDLSRHV